jgi:glycogen(starch) synthase
VPTGYRVEWMDGCEADVAASGEFLLQLAAEIKPDLIHANGYYHAALPFGVPVLLTAHSCVASWWQSCKQEPLPQEWRHYAGWVQNAVRAADLVAAPTRAYLDEFQRLHGRANHTRAIWNGRDPARFRCASKHNIVLAAGRLWDQAKNIGFLCRAVEGTELCLAIAGETRSPDGRTAHIATAHFLGRLDGPALAQRMAEAAIFAAPARYEPFGLAILEAALSGCALVLSDIPSLRELWDGAATFVRPDDLAGWRRALQLLSRNPAMAAADGKNAQAHARQYTAQRMTDAYFDAYQTLLLAGKPVPRMHPAIGAAA